VDWIIARPAGTKVQICAPLIRGKKGEHREVFAAIQREGFVRVRVDGAIYDIRNIPVLDKNKKHNIAAVVDRLIINESVRVRLADSVETALKLADGVVVVLSQKPGADSNDGKWEDSIYSEKFACPEHPESSLEELSPRLFSFNSPYGACKSCDGLGTILEFDPDLIVPDKSKSLESGAIDAWRKGGKRMNIFYNRLVKRFCRDFGVDKSMPFERLPDDIRRILMNGTPRMMKTNTASGLRASFRILCAAGRPPTANTSRPASTAISANCPAPPATALGFARRRWRSQWATKIFASYR
jgi:excinuclease ABC subunit A